MRPTDDEIATVLAREFRCFGGGNVTPGNPISVALKDRPPQFAAGVDVLAVVRRVIELTGPHVAPAASASSGSGRAEARRIVNEHIRGVRPTITHAEMVNDIEAALHAAFLSGRRSMQEEAARVAGKFVPSLPAVRHIVDAIQALNPETKP